MLKVTSIYDTVIYLVMLVLSYLLVDLYQGGDLEAYRNVYENAARMSFSQVYRFSLQELGASEPVYIVFVWVFSKIFSYKVYKLILSFLLIWLLIKFLRQYLSINGLAKNLLLLLFVSTNYYILALITELERLCVSFVLIGLYLSNNEKKYLVLAFGAHLQTLIIIIAHLASDFIFKLAKLTLSKQFVAGLFIFLILYFTYNDLMAQIRTKLYYYFQTSGLTIDNVLLVVLVFPVFVRNLRIFLTLVFISCAGIIVGFDRITVVILFSMIFYIVQMNLNFSRRALLLTLSIGMSTKGFVFISNFLEYGRGYG